MIFMSAPPEIFAAIYRRHGHRCPMSTLGGRLGLAARRTLGGGGEMHAVYNIRTCALDGIAVTTGCREEDASLRVEERGEHRLRLANGDGVVMVALRPAALEIAGRYRLASEALEREGATLPEQERQEREAAVQQILDEVLQALWTLPDEVLLEISPTSGEA
jgi:formylmethanofuran dehydrogenase subunit E